MTNPSQKNEKQRDDNRDAAQLMKNRYDCIIVGGGIAGLTVALRLGHIGWKVLVVERDKLGAGATTSNHGIIHSGALFAELHPDVTRCCQEAQEPFRAAFSDAIVSTPPSWYVGSPNRLKIFERCWRKQGITYEIVPPEVAETILRPEIARTMRCAAVQDTVISTSRMISGLAQYCQSLGVDLLTSCPVKSLIVGEDRITGIRVGVSEIINAQQVVLCCGIGTRQLLMTAKSAVPKALKSRLDLMTAIPTNRLDRPIMCLEYGGPTIAPTIGSDFALVSRFGGPQPWISSPSRWPVPVSEAEYTRDQVGKYLQSSIADLDSAQSWACSKTELSAGHSDAWGVEPNFAVIDHGATESIAGLWTVLPGKMTLALHASRELVKRLSGTDPELFLPKRLPQSVHSIRAEVSRSPWENDYLAVAHNIKTS